MSTRGKTASVALVAGAALLWIAGDMNPRLVSRRAEYGLDAGQPLENAPPWVVFTTVVLGGLRGVVTDILWLRVSHLQMRGEYLEIVQLADWITKLNPRCADHWAYHAWNMGFNVAAVMPGAHERWRWIQHAVRLLRDEGLRYAPGEPQLYCELSWLYLFKIGGTADPAHGYYRRRLACEMHALLGGGQRPADADLQKQPGRDAQLRKLNLLPEIMAQMEARFGQLDWRLPETHALYWAWRGQNETRKRAPLVCYRLMYEAAAESVMNGYLDFSPETDGYATRPNPALLPGAMRAYEETLAVYPDESVRVAYSNFLVKAAVRLQGVDQTASRTAFHAWRMLSGPGESAVSYEEFLRTHGRREIE